MAFISDFQDRQLYRGSVVAESVLGVPVQAFSLAQGRPHSAMSARMITIVSLLGFLALTLLTGFVTPGALVLAIGVRFLIPIRAVAVTATEIVVFSTRTFGAPKTVIARGERDSLDLAILKWRSATVQVGDQRLTLKRSMYDRLYNAVHEESVFAEPKSELVAV